MEAAAMNELHYCQIKACAAGCEKGVVFHPVRRTCGECKGAGYTVHFEVPDELSNI